MVVLEAGDAQAAGEAEAGGAALGAVPSWGDEPLLPALAAPGRRPSLGGIGAEGAKRRQARPYHYAKAERQLESS